jgi:cupin fold WbuC family metalloprotein
MIFDKEFLDKLTEQAKASPRLRQFYDLRDTDNDNSQRMLNAVEPGTVLKIHNHPNTSTVVFVIRGSILQNIYNDKGELTEAIKLEAGNPGVAMYVIEKGVWHNLESLESGTVIFEQKDVKYDSKTDAVFFDEK